MEAYEQENGALLLYIFNNSGLEESIDSSFFCFYNNISKSFDSCFFIIMQKDIISI